MGLHKLDMFGDIIDVYRSFGRLLMEELQISCQTMVRRVIRYISNH